jgi:HK97 family phage prohead protease
MSPALELRRESDGTVTVSGTASRYGVRYEVGHFQERVMPGAASETLASSPDVLFTAEHDRSKAIARTPQTLQLREDGEGLHYAARVDTANDSDARSVVSKIERGVFVESSFAFRVPPGGDEWNSERDQRTIHAFDLDPGDVSVVPFGASPTTTATVQRAVESLQERRALADTISRTGWCGPWLTRAFDLRQAWGNQHGRSCPTCDGSGDCPTCDGKGWVNHDGDDEDGNDGRSDVRRDRTDAQVQALGKQGLALWVGDHYAWPIAGVTDLKAAIQSFGRAQSSAGATAVKAWITKRARALGRVDLLPDSWGVKRSLLAENDSDRLRLELLAPSPMLRRRLDKQERTQAIERFMRELAEDDAPEPRDLRDEVFEAYRRMVGA